jgi:ABC-type phosphate transport system substrate-binding protein
VNFRRQARDRLIGYRTARSRGQTGGDRAFTFVAGADVPVGALTAADARRIFTGAIRIVGWSTDSGTRQALEKYVLGGNPATPVRQAASRRSPWTAAR